MGAYLSSREVVGLGVVWSTFLFAGITFLLIKLNLKIDRIQKTTEKMDSKVADSESIQRLLDKAISLSHAGKSSITTNNKAGGGSSVHE
jgi:hypothetical protein